LINHARSNDAHCPMLAVGAACALTGIALSPHARRTDGATAATARAATTRSTSTVTLESLDAKLDQLRAEVARLAARAAPPIAPAVVPTAQPAPTAPTTRATTDPAAPHLIFNSQPNPESLGEPLLQPLTWAHVAMY